MNSRHAADAYQRTMTAPPAPVGLFADPAGDFRATDPATSMEAAQTASARVTRTRRLVLETLARLGHATDFELAEATGLQQTSAGKRRLDLERAGLAERVVGAKRPTPSGASAQVWAITPAGLAEAAR